MTIIRTTYTDYGSIWEPAYRDIRRGWTVVNGSEKHFDEFSSIREYTLPTVIGGSGYYLMVNDPEALNRLEMALGPHGRTYMRAWYLKREASERVKEL